MPRYWLRMFLFCGGVLSLLSTVVPWGLALLVSASAGTGEYISVSNTGMVTCPEVLQWSEWIDGSGPVYQGSFAERIEPEATIIAYRTGTDANLLAKLTMYQARYRQVDGTVVEWAANGPERLVSINRPLVVNYSAALLVVSLACFGLAHRLARPPKL